MIMTKNWLPVLAILTMLIAACSRHDISLPKTSSVTLEFPMPDVTRTDDPLWIRHHDSSLKILAIGNSFTSNATAFLPYFVNNLNGDSICIATLTEPGCSLRRHWANHCDNLEKYSLEYSDVGEWKSSTVKTLDEAIAMLDWDIIILQEASKNSGDYSSYQPHLENLVNLIRAEDPECKLVWHLTWTYSPGSLHDDFSRYDYDWEKMYYAILDAGSRASKYCDMTINSATLIKEMRETFPEVTDGFSSDGHHITDITAQYALSSLWYETLVASEIGISCIDNITYPINVNAELMNKINHIIKGVIDLPIENEGNSVPMIKKIKYNKTGR